MTADATGAIRVLRGRPGDDELAALLAVLCMLTRPLPAVQARAGRACPWRHGRDPWRVERDRGGRW